MTTLLTTPPATRFETWLMNLDPDHLGAFITGLVVLTFMLCMIPSIIARLGKTESPAPSCPASSNRKAGRVSGGAR